MTTPRDALAGALAELDRAVDRCMALAEMEPADRAEGAAGIVSAYEVADRRVEVMLSALLTAGGCPGLLDVLLAACDRASVRALQPLGPRGRAVAQHAHGRAQSREQQVIAEVALPYWRRRVEAAHAAP